MANLSKTLHMTQSVTRGSHALRKPFGRLKRRPGEGGRCWCGHLPWDAVRVGVDLVGDKACTAKVLPLTCAVAWYAHDCLYGHAATIMED